MRTIFLTSFHNLISRNILSAPFFGMLKNKPDTRIVLLVPIGKKEFFETHFADTNVVVEGVKRKLTRVDGYLGDFALSALRTRSAKIRRRHNMTLFWYSKYLFFWAPLVRRLYQRIYSLLVPRNMFQDVFDRYRPDLIFATDVFAVDSRLLLEARDRDIPTIGMVRSWDNLTTKGPIPVVPDRLVVNNEVIRDEAIRYHDVPKEKIHIVGVPHYDTYTNGPRSSREAFCARVGVDPAKRVVVFAPLGVRFFRGVYNTADRDMIETLSDALPKSHQLLVRLPPFDSVYTKGMRELSNTVFDRGGKQLNRDQKFFKHNELTKEDDDHLVDTLSHCDMVIAVSSTLTIDGAVFDKPQILIDYDSVDRVAKEGSPAGVMRYNHYQPVIKSGGVTMASSPLKLKEAVLRYIKDPTLDREGRRRIAELECYKLDGRSSERLLGVLEKFGA